MRLKKAVNGFPAGRLIVPFYLQLHRLSAGAPACRSYHVKVQIHKKPSSFAIERIQYLPAVGVVPVER